MNIARKIITGVGLSVVIPALVMFYISRNPSVFAFSSRNIIILIVFFIVILGIIVFWNLIRTISSLSNSLKVIAKGNINHQVKCSGENDIEELTDSINQLSQRMRRNADELEKRAILIERFNQEVKKMSNLRTMYPDIVHELRTPLINIEKSSGLLLEKNSGKIDAQDEEFLKTINNNAKRLFRLVDNLLDLSKMEAGHLVLDLSEFSVGEVVNEAVKAVDNWRQSKNINLEIVVSPSAGSIRASRDRIIQVLVNLISNAVKFTPAEGSIVVSALEGPGNSIEFSVRDSGPGVPEEMREKIFQRYKSGSDDSYDDLHSTGLGLSIAREIVELHGGNIRLESSQGRGSKFSFIIPRAQGERPQDRQSGGSVKLNEGKDEDGR